MNLWSMMGLLDQSTQVPLIIRDPFAANTPAPEPAAAAAAARATAGAAAGAAPAAAAAPAAGALRPVAGTNNDNDEDEREEIRGRSTHFSASLAASHVYHPPVELVDIFPSLVSLAGLPPPPSQWNLPGRDLGPIVRQRCTHPRGGHHHPPSPAHNNGTHSNRNSTHSSKHSSTHSSTHDNGGTPAVVSSPLSPSDQPFALGLLGRGVAFSQITRCHNCKEAYPDALAPECAWDAVDDKRFLVPCCMTPRQHYDLMGMSVRTEYYRYTQYVFDSLLRCSWSDQTVQTKSFTLKVYDIFALYSH